MAKNTTKTTKSTETQAPVVSADMEPTQELTKAPKVSRKKDPTAEQLAFEQANRVWREAKDALEEARRRPPNLTALIDAETEARRARDLAHAEMLQSRHSRKGN